MSSSLNAENIGLIPPPSILKRCEQTTTYNWYQSKFDNMKAFIQTVYDSMDEPPIGLKNWINSLSSVNFDIFLTILEREYDRENMDIQDLIQSIFEKEDIDINQFELDDLNKLERYITLFSSMLLS